MNQPQYYSETDYWKNYLAFLPQKYRDAYQIPDESYWNWKNEKIHLDYKFKNSNTTNVILIHGAGGNGRIMSLFGSYLFNNGINYYAPDNLGYGLTKLSSNNFEYADWVNMITDFTNHIIQKDNKPVILIGMSIGGMLAYQVASKVKGVKGLIVTTLADPRGEETMIAMSKNEFLGKFGLATIKKLAGITDGLRLPIKWLCKINLMSRNKNFSKVFMKDKYAGGVKIAMKFLRTFSTYQPEIEFSDFDHCPLMLLHPEKYEWTPTHLSMKVYDKIKGKKESHLLKECGHAPIEAPGVNEMEKHILRFISNLSTQK